jgi:transcriptional regulator with XRE-family HTH domain
VTPDELKARRKALGMTQAQLAQRLRTTVTTISRWENAGREPRHPEMLEMALASLEHSALVDGAIIVYVWDCRAAVARQVDGTGGGFSYQRAANWEELEDDAIQAIQQAGGAVNISGHYRCPAELAKRARWG